MSALRRVAAEDWADWVRARRQRVQVDAEAEELCRRMIEDFAADGDAALLDWVERIEGRRPDSVEQLRLAVPPAEEALGALDAELADAMRLAWERVSAFHAREAREVAREWSGGDGEGSHFGRLVRPLAAVGLYAPGGSAPLFSTVLMAAAPARAVGVQRLALACPAAAEQPAVLAAAALAGIDELWCLGGAQALVALALGTQTIAPVQKLVGPGGRWVTAAKRALYGRVGIDMVAGPSEVLVIADGSADPRWVAADMLAQAEHDELASALCLTTDAALAEALEREIAERLQRLPRPELAAAIRDNGVLCVAPDLDWALQAANDFAPEHLHLAVADPEPLLPQVRAAGAVFVGHLAGEVLGDYLAGPNHILPTAGAAAYHSGLGVLDLVVRPTFLRCDSPEGAAKLGRSAAVMARAEGLEAHAESAELRLGNH